MENPAKQNTFGLLEDQCAYNKSNVTRMERIESHLEALGRYLFFTTAFVAAVFLIYAFGAWLLCLGGRIDPLEQAREHIEQVVTALTAGLPALATATYGIRLIGDFDGIAHRSERTQAILQKLILLLNKTRLRFICCAPAHKWPLRPCLSTFQLAGGSRKPWA